MWSLPFSIGQSPLALAEHPRACAVNEDRQSVVKATPFRNAITPQYGYGYNATGSNTGDAATHPLYEVVCIRRVHRESDYPPLLSGCYKLQISTLMVDRTSRDHSSPTNHAHQDNPRPVRRRCYQFLLVCADFLSAAASTTSIDDAMGCNVTATRCRVPSNERSDTSKFATALRARIKVAKQSYAGAV
ncbi:hypothetical protein CSAL01_08659 [Colletotrichum salicis]|uniref:Uncharacterized protein n=1 Tax=Colletotrichum salicis TaxID=1209931 RepID=A0A135UGB7_9PEZI|nr:hypothetical protein CSAL01_08659 [Colletotrichum salicis]